MQMQRVNKYKSLEEFQLVLNLYLQLISGARALRVARPKRQETLESTWKMITEGRHVPLTRHDHGGDNPPARIRKDPSVGQEELNRRVEAFINKFNENLRIQRQESLQQLTEMINRGV